MIRDRRQPRVIRDKAVPPPISVQRMASERRTFQPISTGSHIKGIPLVMFEGSLTNIECRIQLYPFVRQGPFNVRALGSLEAENLFDEFQDLDPRGSGIMRPDDIPLDFRNACQLVNARMDPNRNHVFDLDIRCQRTCQRKRGEISKPGMSSKGAQPNTTTPPL